MKGSRRARCNDKEAAWSASTPLARNASALVQRALGPAYDVEVFELAMEGSIP